MTNDDIPVGRLLNRRDALTLLGLSGLGLAACSSNGSDDAGGTTAPAGTDATVAGTTSTTSTIAAESGTTAPASTAAPAATTQVDCVATPEMTEGPYFVDEQLDRSDIRTDPSDGSTVVGTPLVLTLGVLGVTGSSCAPLEGALVDIWHCDAFGVYSDVQAEGTIGRKFLRGQQTTDAGGTVAFTTILPGWYRGRTVHIHLKVRTTGADGNTYELTSQLFFDDAFAARYLTEEPYAGRGAADTTNARDGIYANGGDQMVLAPTPSADGYAAVFTIGLV